MTSAATQKQRHHGNLKTALVDAGMGLLSEGGLSALTLRKCAARAGVSHAAPAHHFNGLKGLLTAMVARGFEIFTQSMIEHRDGAGDDPHEKLVAVCDGYLAFAKRNEAIATLMFMKEKFFTDDEGFQSASTAAYRVLADACAPFEPGASGSKGTEILIWSLVQGYATLVSSGQANEAVTPFSDILPMLKLRSDSRLSP